MARRVIPIHVAPQAPRCFPSRQIWLEYLQSAQDHPNPKRRPFDGEHYKQDFNFCLECPPKYRRSMEIEMRCDYRIYARAKWRGGPKLEEAHAE